MRCVCCDSAVRFESCRGHSVTTKAPIQPRTPIIAFVQAHEGVGGGTMQRFVVIACVICAVIAIGLSLLTYMDVSLYGFPDGYVTDYQNAARAPLTVLAWVAAGIGVLFVVTAFSPIGTRVRTFAWLALLVTLMLIAAGVQIGIPWYFGTRLGLDNGIGG